MTVRALARLARAVAGSALGVSLLSAALVAGSVGAAASTSGAGASRGATAAPATKVVKYLGERLAVPASWPVFHLEREPSTCVRFDRHAVYLGQAGPDPRCLGGAIGVTGAVQVQPLTAATLAELEVADGLVRASVNGQEALVSTATAVTHRVVAAFPNAGVEVTISYRSDSAAASRILASARWAGGTGPSSRSPVGTAAGTTATALSPASSAAASSRTPSPAASSDVTGSVVYQGKGFDTCDAPAPAEMTAWQQHSPYGSIGVYIGGVDAACTNITSTWVEQETAAGWRLFPIYVGLQAPCVYQAGLATMSWSTSTAHQQGSIAAKNAIADAESFGIGPGVVLYYDMEGWNTASASCNAAVVSFIKGWTGTLHSNGYASGMYGSAGAGISPVIDSIYGESDCPDDVYFAQWDGVATTGSGYIPSSDWSGNQRIKQYLGNVTETYGGVTLSIDEDYLDAPTVGAATTGSGGPVVTSISPAKGPAGNRLTVIGSGFEAGSTSVDFGSVAATSVDVVSPDQLYAVVPAQATPSVPVTVSTPAGSSAAAGSSQPTFTYTWFAGIAAQQGGSGWWYASRAGNVENFGASFEGSPFGLVRPSAPVVGIAATSTGYVVATAAGNVYAYGTRWHGSPVGLHLTSRVVGIAATPSGGYVVATAAGNVYAYGTPWHGSPVGLHLTSRVVGIAANASGGYIVVTAGGNVYAYGTTWEGSLVGRRLPAPVVGVAATSTGYLVATAKGNVYPFNTPWHGSEAKATLPSRIVGITATSTGYVLASADGEGYAFHTTWEGSPANP
ncbi:MAG TPA: glycoside hydrolase domain-containing protein [Acidimicrobiales bacterium]|nr:glycoside hydrolase domain-containing protein [Acidimicrobiales bacterium]